MKKYVYIFKSELISSLSYVFNIAFHRRKLAFICPNILFIAGNSHSYVPTYFSAQVSCVYIAIASDGRCNNNLQIGVRALAHQPGCDAGALDDKISVLIRNLGRRCELDAAIIHAHRTGAAA